MSSSNDDEPPPRRLFRIKTWEELQAIPGYIPKISKFEITEGEIRGRYTMARGRQEPCAITQCGTRHLSGLIVVLKGVTVTHIGHNCGDRYFPDWERMLSNFRAEEDVETSELKFLSMKDDAAALSGRLDALRPLVESQQKLKLQFQQRLPRAIVDEVIERASRDKSLITVARRLTSDERDRAKETGDSAAKWGMTEVKVGRIAGLGLFRPGNDPWHIATYDIIPVIKKALDAAAPDERLAKNLANCAALLDGVERGLQFSRQFFTDANLKELLKLPRAKAVRLENIHMSAIEGIVVKLRDAPTL